MKTAPGANGLCTGGYVREAFKTGGKTSVRYFPVTWFLLCPVGSSRIKSLDLPARNK